MGKFTFQETGIESLWVIEPAVFGDARGYFMETYNRNDFFTAGLAVDFVQDNQSYSTKGVLRGLHYQIKYPQGKLIRVLDGEVFDVAVDLRRTSATYGKWYGIYLSGENKKQFYVPPGFAHGFLVTSDQVTFAYKCTDFYHPEDEGGLRYDDPDIGVRWPLDGDVSLKLSDKDKNLPYFRDIDDKDNNQHCNE